jgi:nitroimidazol reductase NimA-like FMN-containing flavoprotein (pyridoxamine 5'-phosphate oxidase superfamily)
MDTAERFDLAVLRRAFRDVPVAHVASAGFDGSPHVVPLWFVWLEDAVFVTCRDRSQVHRNLRRDPRVAVEVERGRAWTEQSGVLLRGAAVFLPPQHPSHKRAISAWFEKYRGDLGRGGFDAYTAQVEGAALFRVDVHRVAGWSHASPRPT